MGWVSRQQDRPQPHECAPPIVVNGPPWQQAVGAEGDLWRCDDCRKLWRVGPACDGCDRYGHGGCVRRHTMGEIWRPASFWQRVQNRKEDR